MLQLSPPVALDLLHKNFAYRVGHLLLRAWNFSEGENVRASKGLPATTSIGLRWHPGGRFATAVDTLFAHRP
jgi:hypothetical protein